MFSKPTKNVAVRSGGLLEVAGVSLLCACGPTSPDSTLEGPSASLERIVGGQIEGGWDAVGALTLELPMYGYLGSQCTGVLIDPSWVLTAAHCVGPQDYFVPDPRHIFFFLGQNANPASDSQRPIRGRFFAVDKFHIFPDYDESAFSHDIALVHLAEPVEHVTPHLVNQRALDGSMVGRRAFYVGYGATEGVHHRGGGLKRSAYIGIDMVRRDHYVGLYDEDEGTGVCFGDSGGPGFLEFDGEWRVIGVNSSVAEPDNGDPCHGAYLHTRVDAYATWIAETTRLPPPDCRTDEEICFCPEACKEDGSCLDEACQTLGCAQLVGCLAACESDDFGCHSDCHLQATQRGRDLLADVLRCGGRRCSEAIDNDAYNDCLATDCGGELDSCFNETLESALTCREVAECVMECSDSACNNACHEQGTRRANRHYQAMKECFESECAEDANQPDVWRDCVFTRCAEQINTCYEFSDCPLTGGGCPEGEACAPIVTGASECFLSEGRAEGTRCNDTGVGALPCADGLACLGPSNAEVCTTLCVEDGDCGGRGFCFAPIYGSQLEVGACMCVDDDNDGACAPQDCDDDDHAIHPGVEEICGDERDNNCDGQTDEDCDPPEPLSCPMTGGGCDEGLACHPTTPGVTQCLPSDGLDLGANCDPSSTERLPCVDGLMCWASGERASCTQVCERDEDCRLGVPCQRPAFEGIDELGACVCNDVDQDDVCEPLDCDDADPATFPGAKERCGDGRDNDCDGQVDEECPASEDVGQDEEPISVDESSDPKNSGGCAAAGGFPPLAGLWVGLGAVLSAWRRRRRSSRTMSSGLSAAAPPPSPGLRGFYLRPC